MKSIKILNSNSHLIILALWFINDLVLKIFLPNFVVGKISDIFGIYLSPFILTSILVTLFSKLKEEIVFYSTSLLIFIVFLSINLSQTINDSIYNLLEIGFKNKGTADPTDIICLFMLVPSFFKFKTYQPRIEVKKEKKLILLLSFVVFINSPAEPTGRSDVVSVLLLLSSPTEAIYLESPINSKKVMDSENFIFRFVGKKNESNPATIESLTIPDTCSNVNEIPIESTYPLTGSNTNSPPLMYFNNYLIVISKDREFRSTSLQSNCSSFDCILNLSKLEEGIYFWRVLTQFTYFDKCVRYIYKNEPKQTRDSFLK